MNFALLISPLVRVIFKRVFTFTNSPGLTPLRNILQVWRATHQPRRRCEERQMWVNETVRIKESLLIAVLPDIVRLEPTIGSVAQLFVLEQCDQFFRRYVLATGVFDSFANRLFLIVVELDVVFLIEEFQ